MSSNVIFDEMECFNEMAKVMGFPEPYEDVGYMEIYEAMKKMKAEIDKLKWDCEQMGKSPWVGTPACDKMLKLIEEKKELEQEHQDFNEIILDLGEYVQHIDQNACDVFNKLTEKYRDEYVEMSADDRTHEKA